MAGTPRSQACDNCRRRKKKCGQEHPRCKSCVAAKLPCSGSFRRWKFVNETQQLSAYYKQRRYLLEDITVFGIQYGHRHSYDPQLYRSRTPSLSRNLPMILIPSLALAHGSLSAYLWYIVNNPNGLGICPGALSFLNFVPARIGSNAALDAAVLCFSRLCESRLQKSSESLLQATRSYRKALRELQFCLQKPHTSYDSETICASIILQTCEVMLNPQQPNWLNLARGSKFLIANSSPKIYLSEFERTMLDSQRMVLMMQEIFDVETSFLSNPDWRDVLRPSQISAQWPYPQPLHLETQLSDLLVGIPGLLLDLSNRPFHAVQDPSTASSLRRTMSRATGIVDNINSWISDKIEPMIQQGSLESESPSPGDTSHTYPDSLIAVLDCFANSIVLQLESLIRSVSLTLPIGNEPALSPIDDSNAGKRRGRVQQSYKFLESCSAPVLSPLSTILHQFERVIRSIEKSLPRSAR